MKPHLSPALDPCITYRLSLGVGRGLLLVLLGLVTSATGEPVCAADCVASPTGLISWWRGEGNGSDASDGNHATLLGDVEFIPGKVSQSFNLDGVDDRVLVANTAALNFGPGADFSIEAWIQPQPAVTDFGVQSIVDKRFTPDSAAAVGYAFALIDGKLACQLADAPLASLDFSTFLSPGPDLRDGQFHHVAMAVERTATNGGKLYVDGQVVLTFDPTVQPGDLSTSEPLRIGNHADPALNAHFKGRIDELALYDRALEPPARRHQPAGHRTRRQQRHGLSRRLALDRRGK